MVWTYLRSCYKFTMRVYIGGVERHFPARWFFCKPGALPFPFSHGAESSPYLDNYETNEAWGEITPYPTDPLSNVFRGLDRGLNPGYPGKCYVGDPQWFVDGMLPAGILDGPPPPLDPCCHIPPVVATGGLLIGGTAVPFQPIIGPCSGCIGGNAPPAFRIIASGGTGDFVGMNGTWPVTTPGPCFFLETTAGIQAQVNVGIGFGSFAQLFDAGRRSVVAWGKAPPWNCFQQTGGWTITNQIGTGTPPVITVGP
jgi:hypothetical protein